MPTYTRVLRNNLLYRPANLNKPVVWGRRRGASWSRLKASWRDTSGRRKTLETSYKRWTSPLQLCPPKNWESRIFHFLTPSKHITMETTLYPPESTLSRAKRSPPLQFYAQARLKPWATSNKTSSQHKKWPNRNAIWSPPGPKRLQLPETQVEDKEIRPSFKLWQPRISLTILCNPTTPKSKRGQNIAQQLLEASKVRDWDKQEASQVKSFPYLPSGTPKLLINQQIQR
jgi:hypothetical protein